jgi:hypothetical protein
MLLYSICYYYGKNKQSNIINHLTAFLKIDCDEKDKEFVLINMVDSRDPQYINEAERELSEFIMNFNSTISFKIISEFNWGGTIVALWLTYNYGKKYGDSCYIAQFEEDFYAINDKWYDDSIELLNDNHNAIYIGEHVSNEYSNKITENIKKTEKEDFMYIINKYNQSTYENTCCWTDGGFYFSTIIKLKQIEDKIGIFHKGDMNVKYDHFIDGIALGEVGFPTILFHNNFIFIGLYRHNYFIHNE